VSLEGLEAAGCSEVFEVFRPEPLPLGASSRGEHNWKRKRPAVIS